ncbi:hypothetical protein HID58_072440 [Brassica napus]|uniref:DNA-(apurinic or apyrimidinic site) endonuclease n=1 Tax=Brassica napus TaxID=3708 RepID=A0ABQ7Z4K7_BRANA|nr:hypothetical protein HID58_072440 [Brassica napus]
MCWRIVLLDKQTRKELISALRLHMDSNLQDESSGEEIKETTSSTRSESVTIKRKIRSREDEQKSLAKTGKQKLRLKEEEASLTKAYNPMTMRPPPLPEGTKSVKIMTWNVNGLRALLKLESFSPLQLAQRENFDVFVSKLGYSGTAIISRVRQECA